MAPEKELAKSLSGLSLTTAMKSRSEVVDSWEDEEEEDEESTTPPLRASPALRAPSPSAKVVSRSSPAPVSNPSLPRSAHQIPPPSDAPDFDMYTRPYPAGQSRPTPTMLESGKRPEKTTAVANRLIAGALGVRAPRRTEEQRAYDRAVKQQEQKKRDKEKEDRQLEEQRREQAKRSMWDG